MPALTPATGVPASLAPAGDEWTRRRPGRVLWLGRTGYDEALALQLELHARRVAGEIPDTLLLLEHDSVYTSGRAADPAHFLTPPAALELQGHAVRATHRGGDVTWHGPGQVVCYAIIDLGDSRRDIHRYLRLLEEALIRVAASFGVAAHREPSRTGAWCAGGKIAAIGIRVSRWVTQHGTAFNVAPDLSRFQAIVPCGLHGADVTSLLRETGSAPSIEAAALEHARAFADVLALDLTPDSELPHVG